MAIKLESFTLLTDVPASIALVEVARLVYKHFGGVVQPGAIQGCGGALLGGTMSLLGFFVAIIAVLVAVADSPGFALARKDGHIASSGRFGLEAIVSSISLCVLSLASIITSSIWVFHLLVANFVLVMWQTLKMVGVLLMLLAFLRKPALAGVNRAESASA